MNKKNNRKGFTTVELVIVIAVIAILATVLIPTFSNLIGKANDSKYLQTAKSAHTTYMTDFNYSTGETPETNLIVEVIVDGDTNVYLIVEGNELSSTVYKTLAEAEDALDTNTQTAAKGDAITETNDDSNLYKVVFTAKNA